MDYTWRSKRVLCGRREDALLTSAISLDLFRTTCMQSSLCERSIIGSTKGISYYDKNVDELLTIPVGHVWDLSVDSDGGIICGQSNDTLKYFDSQIQVRQTYKLPTKYLDVWVKPGKAQNNNMVSVVDHCRHQKEKFASVHFQNIALWNIDCYLTPTEVLKDEINYVSAAKWSNFDSHLLAAGNADGKLSLYDSRDFTGSVFITDCGSELSCIDWHPFLPYWISVGLDNGGIQIWDLRYNSKIPPVKMDGHMGNVNDLTWSNANCELLLSVGSDGTIRFWTLKDDPAHHELFSKKLDHEQVCLNRSISGVNCYQGISSNSNLYEFELNPSYLENFAPHEYHDADIDLFQVESYLYSRDMLKTYEKIAQVAKNTVNEVEFEKLEEIVDLCVPPKVLNLDWKIGIFNIDYRFDELKTRMSSIPNSPSLKPGKKSRETSLATKCGYLEFYVDLETYSYHFPPNFTLFIDIPMEIKALLKTVTLKVKLNEWCNENKYLEIITIERQIVSAVRSDYSALGTDLLLKIINTLLIHVPFKAYKLALALFEIFRNEDEFQRIERIAHALLYPTVYDFEEQTENKPQMRVQIGRNRRRGLRFDPLSVTDSPISHALGEMFQTLLTNSKSSKKLNSPIDDRFESSMADISSDSPAVEEGTNLTQAMDITDTPKEYPPDLTNVLRNPPLVLSMIELEAEVHHLLFGQIAEQEKAEYILGQAYTISCSTQKLYLSLLLSRGDFLQFFCRIGHLKKSFPDTPFIASLGDFIDSNCIPRLEKYFGQLKGNYSKTLKSLIVLSDQAENITPSVEFFLINVCDHIQADFRHQTLFTSFKPDKKGKFVATLDKIRQKCLK